MTIATIKVRPCEICKNYVPVPGTDLYACSKWDCDKKDVEETENTEVEE